MPFPPATRARIAAIVAQPPPPLPLADLATVRRLVPDLSPECDELALLRRGVAA